MSWITVIWSTALGTCLMMMLVHLLAWSRDRKSWANLCFSVAVLSVIALVALEMVSMHTQSPEVFGATFRWAHFFYGVGVWASLGFVHFYFGTGRRWLLVLALALRLCAVVANFTTGQNLHVAAIRSLQQINFLGDHVSTLGQWTSNPWVRLGQLAALFQIGYVMDASIRLWHTGSRESRRRALTVGGSLSFFMLFAAAQSALVTRGTLRTPFLVSLPFLGMLLAMGYELSRDVLRAAQLARELGEKEQRLDLAASAGDLGMWRWNVADDQVWMNEKGLSLLGFSARDKVTAEQVRSRVHREDRAAVKAIAAPALASGADYETECRIVLPDNTTRWLHSRGRVELGANGKPWRVHGVSFDVTQRKLTEEALLESEMRFRVVADAAPVMIWMSDTDKQGTFFNKGWLEFTGRSLDQELGEGWLKGVHPEDLAHCLDVCGAAFGRREPFTVEYRLRRKDGEYRWLIDTGTPRFESDGTFLGYIGSCIDITARKQAELQRQRQDTELARVGRVALMGEFAASLAHEINNPVGAMVANASAGQRMLANGQLGTDELRELLADIVADGHRAREVIQGVRNMVRKSETSHAIVRIDDVLRDLLQIVRAEALERNVKIKQQINSDAGSVRANRVQLVQVLLNLTLNAFEAMAVNRPDARCLVISSNPGSSGEIVIQVRDQGPGFPPGISKELFEPFFSTKAEGTGMGLAIARGIVEAHGGTLSGENCESGGACFTVRLPAAKDDRAETDCLVAGVSTELKNNNGNLPEGG
ncbi:MAG TPA: PAS domain-containing protein [Candidatus Sulfotelmatobacter sp.]|jgi:PAS domain S-box-containing protein|nr:PAS domain-containing protein [Candidatus Sulfotelmatobacter sp.]